MQKDCCKQLMLIVWLFFIFLLTKGFSFVQPSQTGLAPSIYHLANPNFLSGDWYINSLASAHNLFQLFYAKLMHFMKLPLLFFFSYCIALLLYIFSLKKLSKILFVQDRSFYILFSFLMIWHTGGIEYNNLLNLNNFTSVFLAIPIGIFAVAYFFENRMLQSFILAGAATAVHLHIGVNMFIILLSCYLILNFRILSSRISKDIGVPVLCYLMIAAWPLILTFPALTGADVADAHFFIKFLKFRLSPHYILSSFWEIKSFVLHFGLLCLLGFMSFKNNQKDNIDKKSMTLVSVIFMGMLIQYIFIELIPIDLLARFQFYRMSIFITMMAFMYIADYLRNMLDSERNYSIFLMVIMFVSCKNPLLGIILFLLIRLIKNSKQSLRVKYTWISFGLIFLAFVASMVGNLFFFSHKFFIASIIIGSFFYILIKIPKLKLNSYSTCLIPLLILSTITLGKHAANGFFYNINTRLIAKNDWEKLCFWIKENTSSTSFFIAPPYEEGFHLYAERKVLMNMIIHPVLEKDIVEWKKRLEDILEVDDIFVYTGDIKQRYNSLSENKIKYLKKKYNADYIIFEKPKALPFETLYENEHFVVYKLPASLPVRGVILPAGNLVVDAVRAGRGNIFQKY